MTSTQITYFLTLAECGSFSMTADIHYVTQPVISKQISALESEFDLKLFTRSPRQTTLTAAGRILYEYYKTVNVRLEETLCLARQAQNAEFGKISIGITLSPDLADIAPAVRFLEKKYPHASIVVTEQILPIWPSEIRSGQYDVAVTEFNDHFNFRDLPFIRLATSDEYLIYSADHPLADKPGLTMRDFEQEDFVFLMASSETQFPINKFQQLCRKNRLSKIPRYFFVDSIDIMNSYIQSCKAVSVRKIPRTQEEREQFRYIGVNSSLPIGISYNSGSHNPLVEDFIAHVLELQRVFQTNSKNAE